KADLPRAAGMGEAGQGRSAGAALVARDGDVVGLALADARGDRANPDFAHQLDRDARLPVDVLEVVDQLRQVLDRIDVVVRRRADQADAWGRMAHRADHLVDLVTGQLAAFAGLGAL